MREWQDPADDPAALGDQVICRVPKGAFDNPPPTGEMEECSVRMGEHELIPALLVTRPKRSYGEA